MNVRVVLEHTGVLVRVSVNLVISKIFFEVIIVDVNVARSFGIRLRMNVEDM